MATILFKNGNKEVVEAEFVQNYLEHGWSVEDKPVEAKRVEDKPKLAKK